VESQNAPNREVRPDTRAIWPSIRSLKTNAVTTSTPSHSSPCGKNTRAPALTPIVPTSVTASGLMPIRRKSFTNGARTTPCQKALNRSIMVAAGYPSYEGHRVARGYCGRTAPFRGR
jgi:hypothetical protein